MRKKCKEKILGKKVARIKIKSSWDLFYSSGGTDETRTRDLCRDRAAL